jgi:membrane protein required for beta-lactamase induction
MSEWTVDTLREHLETMLKERDLRFQQRFEAGEKRLDGMNEFRETLNDAQKTFVTWPVVVAFVVAACAITGTVVGLLTFFMRK